MHNLCCWKSVHNHNFIYFLLKAFSMFYVYSLKNEIGDTSMILSRYFTNQSHHRNSKHDFFFFNITGTYHEYLQGKYNLDRMEKSTNFNEFHRNIVSIIWFDNLIYKKKELNIKLRHSIYLVGNSTRDGRIFKLISRKQLQCTGKKEKRSKTNNSLKNQQRQQKTE